jgi:hypothetical protein
MPNPATHRLNQAQRDELTRRVLAGEKATALAQEFSITRAYVALLKAQALNPERYIRRAEGKLSRKLTPAEAEKFRETLAGSTPEDHDLIPTAERWSLEHGQQLAWKLFQKKLSVRALTDFLTPFIPKRSEFRFSKPKPPKPHHINQISPELAKDPHYVAYYLSPICEQIVRREYELALADWEARFADAEERHQQQEKARQEGTSAGIEPQGPLARGRRIGKHSNSKGSPFTSPKRRKKRR